MAPAIALLAIPFCALAAPGGDAAVPAPVHTLTIAAASADHPRHSEGAMVELHDGSILLIWQEFLPSEHGGEDNAPSRLSAMTSNDGGLTWGNHRVLVESLPGDVNVYSPNLIRLDTGEILFLFMRYHSLYPCQTSGYVWVSRDEGATFEPYAVAWERQTYGLCSATLRQLPSGRLVLPMSRPAGIEGPAMDHWIAGALLSDDRGLTWRESANWVDLPMRGCMEPHVAWLPDASLLMFMRTQLGTVYASRSTDSGETWSEPASSGLVAPESCPELINVPGTDTLLAIWNDGAYDPDWYSHLGKRTPLTVALSRDGGKTWQPRLNVETDPGWAFSNPACAFHSNGTAILSYWACPYEPSGRMGVDRIDLKAAIVDLSLFQSVP